MNLDADLLWQQANDNLSQSKEEPMTEAWYKFLVIFNNPSVKVGDLRTLIDAISYEELAAVHQSVLNMPTTEDDYWTSCIGEERKIFPYDELFFVRNAAKNFWEFSKSNNKKTFL